MKLQFLIPLLLAGPAFGEGAVMRLDCRETSICQIDGTCQEDVGTRLFAVHPKEVNADGFGTYSVSTDGGDQRPAAGTSRTGPFQWTDQSSRNFILTLLSDDRALLLSRPAEDPLAGTVSFLRCEVIL